MVVVGRGENVSNLFSGVAHCRYCGEKMRYRDEGQRSYLQCTKALRGMGCEKKVWNYKEFEKTFVDFVRDIPTEELTNTTTKETKLRTQVDAMKAQIAEHDAKLEALVDALDKVTSDTITRKIAERESQKAVDVATLEKLEQELLTIAKSTAGQDLQSASVHHLLTSYDKRSQYAQLLKSVVERVIIAPAGSAPIKNANHTVVVGEEIYEHVVSKKQTKVAGNDMDSPWFAIRLRNDPTHAKVFPGTVIMLD
jgi:hypothetical protein